MEGEVEIAQLGMRRWCSAQRQPPGRAVVVWHRTVGGRRGRRGPFLIDGGPMWFSKMLEWLA
jgi:hypothetical protein